MNLFIVILVVSYLKIKESINMSKNLKVPFFIISDSVGTTGMNLARAALAQFTEVDSPIYNYPFVDTNEEIISVLEKAKEQKAIVLHTFANRSLVSTITSQCEDQDIQCVDVLTPIISILKDKTGEEPLQKAGGLHKLDEEYFNRISALEFAVKYDDGKDAKGFLEADILLLGISRTSKTPLSIYLANQNYKVANLPLMPETNLPEELWQVDPSKIVGLTTTEEVILSFRQERMKAYGMSPHTAYASSDRIKKEINYAENLYNKIGCLTINVSNKSIEETTAIIINSLNL